MAAGSARDSSGPERAGNERRRRRSRTESANQNPLWLAFRRALTVPRLPFLFLIVSSVLRTPRPVSSGRAPPALDGFDRMTSLPVFRSFADGLAVCRQSGLAVAASARACSCRPPPSTVVLTHRRMLCLSARSSRSEGASARGDLDFKFGVIDAFKGVTVKEITVREREHTAACGYPFRVGEPYLVFARHHHGLYYSGICGRTQPLAVATDDLEMLRQIKTGRVTSRVLGTALRRQLSLNRGYYGYEDAGAMIGLPIAVRGAGASRET